MTPRVLFLNHSATMGGAEFCLLDIATNLRKSAMVVLLEDGPFRHRLEAAGVTVVVIDAGALHQVRRTSKLPSATAVASVWRAARAVAAIARNFAVIHANSQKALIVASLAARWSATPLVWHLHDIIEPPAFSKVNIAVDVWLANHRTDRVLAVSRATAAAFVRQGGDSDRVHVVYNGIDTAPFDVVPTTKTFRQLRGLQDVPLIGCFSRLAEWKGQHVLIDAVAKLPGMHVLLVGGALFGEHEYEATLRTLVHGHGMTDRVHFLGQRDDVAALMRQVDLVVHPSISPEPFARTLIEAMLAGNPPIASACGGVPELIETGSTGYLFPPGDVETLRSLLARLIDSPEEVARVSCRAQAHARRHFAMPAFVSAVNIHLDAAAANGRVRQHPHAPRALAR